MEEVYTCSCGAVEWLINESSIICVKCGNKYSLGILDLETGFIHDKLIPSPENFNKTKDKLFIKNVKEIESLTVRELFPADCYLSGKIIGLKKEGDILSAYLETETKKDDISRVISIGGWMLAKYLTIKGNLNINNIIKVMIKNEINVNDLRNANIKGLKEEHFLEIKKEMEKRQDN